MKNCTVAKDIISLAFKKDRKSIKNKLSNLTDLTTEMVDILYNIDEKTSFENEVFETLKKVEESLRELSYID